MTDAHFNPAAQAAGRATTAGGLIREARQAQGLHIAALAAAIKVVPRKLELLESDQIDQLPDATFTRALAQTICRSLKIDAAPILALLPPSRVQRLEHVASGLNTPFHERPGRLAPNDGTQVASPTLWIAGLLLLAALAVYLVPEGWLRLPEWASPSPATNSAPGSDPAIPLGTTAIPAPAVPADVPADVPVAVAPSVAAPTPPPVVTAGMSLSVLQLRATAPSWVGVTDARGQALIGRVLLTGETVDINGQAPLKLRIGNVLATRLVFRGQPFDLAPFTRGNVARFELE